MKNWSLLITVLVSLNAYSMENVDFSHTGLEAIKKTVSNPALQVLAITTSGACLGLYCAKTRRAFLFNRAASLKADLHADAQVLEGLQPNQPFVPQARRWWRQWHNPAFKNKTAAHRYHENMWKHWDSLEMKALLSDGTNEGVVGAALGLAVATQVTK